MSLFTRICNRILNYGIIRHKVFCIGLHRTGTTSLAVLARQYGFRAMHSTGWIRNPAVLARYDFFSDGGSHFDGTNEFDFESLFHTYPKAKFILQVRETEPWIYSKLSLAGWNIDTIIQEDEMPETNKVWRYKSLLNIEKFIEHKYHYEARVKEFFNTHDPARLLVVDITDEKIQKRSLDTLTEFLKLRSVNAIHLPRLNTRSETFALSDQVKAHIRIVIAKQQ